MSTAQAKALGFQWAQNVRASASDIEAAVYLEVIYNEKAYPGLVDAFCKGSQDPRAVAPAPIPDQLMGLPVRRRA